MFLLTLNQYLLAGLTLHIGFNTCYNLRVFQNNHVACVVFRFIQSKFPNQDKNSWFTIASLFSRTYFLKYPEERQWKTLSHFFHSNCISICFSLFKFLSMCQGLPNVSPRIEKKSSDFIAGSFNYWVGVIRIVLGVGCYRLDLVFGEKKRKGEVISNFDVVSEP